MSGHTLGEIVAAYVAGQRRVTLAELDFYLRARLARPPSRLAVSHLLREMGWTPHRDVEGRRYFMPPRRAADAAAAQTLAQSSGALGIIVGTALGVLTGLVLALLVLGAADLLP